MILHCRHLAPGVVPYDQQSIVDAWQSEGKLYQTPQVRVYACEGEGVCVREGDGVCVREGDGVCVREGDGVCVREGDGLCVRGRVYV